MATAKIAIIGNGNVGSVGPLLNARYLETLGFLTIQLGHGPTKYGTDLGFKVVGKFAR